ncbi:MAG: hypothetical protein R3Y57_04710 [Erysipelotrichaceae bacterium]
MDTKNLVLISFLSALLIISKELLSALANVELVTFLLMIYATNMKLKDSLMIAFIFVFMQIPLYGFGDWTLVYFVVWPVLVWGCYKMRNHLNTVYKMSIVSGLFGLCFGLFFSIPYLLVSIDYAWIYFLRGLVYDVIHCLSNVLIMLILYDMVNKQFKKLIAVFKI